MCPGTLIFLSTIGSCLYSFFSKIKEILGMSVNSKTTANNDNTNDNDIFNDIIDENQNQNQNNNDFKNTNNIEVKPIINIKLNEIDLSKPTTDNDILKELIKLEEKKVDTIRRMYSLQAKMFECPKCNTKIILPNNNDNDIDNDNLKKFAFPDSLTPAKPFKPLKSLSFLKRNYFSN